MFISGYSAHLVSKIWTEGVLDLARLLAGGKV